MEYDLGLLDDPVLLGLVDEFVGYHNGTSKEGLGISLSHMDVSKNRGILPKKWMVYFMENTIKIDDLGVPLLLETPILSWLVQDLLVLGNDDMFSIVFLSSKWWGPWSFGYPEATRSAPSFFVKISTDHRVSCMGHHGKSSKLFQWIFQVPVKGGRDYITP